MSPSSLKRITNWLCLASLSVLVATASAAPEILYGVSNGMGDPTENLIYQINPANGDLSNIVPITLPGSVIGRTQSLVARPSDGVLFALV